MRYFFPLIVLFLLQSINSYACKHSVVIDASKPLESQFVTEDTRYIINVNCNLNGKTLNIPTKCEIKFINGCFSNGSLTGSKTTILAGPDCVFQDVECHGTWKNKVVYSEWLGFVEGSCYDNKDKFVSLMNLCNGDLYTDLYMQKGDYYCSVIKESSYIKVPSNTYWHNSATIHQLPTDLQKYSLIFIHRVSNVTIDGGAFIGDVRTHIDKGGEWGHGIKCAGSKNVTIKNLTSNEFWGDGIELNEGRYDHENAVGWISCENVKIDNVKCLYNRRSALSLEAVIDAKIINSEFAYTGGIKMTLPGDGVDIEPWCGNEKKIWNIHFYNCNVHDNFGERDFACQPNFPYYENRKNAKENPRTKIIVEKCDIGNLYIIMSNEVVFDKCVIDTIIRYAFSDDVTIKRSTINVIKDKSEIQNLTLLHNH